MICTVCVYLYINVYESAWKVQLLPLSFKSNLLVICFIILLDDICVFLFDLMMTMMMETARLEMDSDKHLCISIPEANSKKFDDINNNYYPSKDKEEIFDDCHSTMKSNVLSSDKHENDTTLLTTTTMTTTVEVKVKTTKTSSRKRKLDLLNSNTEDEHQEQIDKQTAISKNKVINLFFFRIGNWIAKDREKKPRKFNLYFFFWHTHTHTRHPWGIMISWCVCVRWSYLLFFVNIYPCTAALFLLHVLSYVCLLFVVVQYLSWRDRRNV